MSRPPELPTGVGYAPSSASSGANGHDPLAYQAHYATLTEVMLPISGLVVTVRPVDGMDLYRLGLPPSFFTRPPTRPAPPRPTWNCSSRRAIASPRLPSCGRARSPRPSS